MGSVSFKLPPSPGPEVEECLRAAVLAGGYDTAPAPTRQTREGDTLTFTKDANESGYLLTPWPVGGAVEACLTSTLRERPEPYDLVVELARGKVNQLRTQAAEWEGIGLTVGPAERRGIVEATKLFGRATLATDAVTAADFAGRAIARASAAGNALAADFAVQLLETRLGEGGPLDTRLDLRLTHAPAADLCAGLPALFGAVTLTPDWSRVEPSRGAYDWAEFDTLVEWALDAGFDVTIGPVIDLADGAVPGWLAGHAGDEYLKLADAMGEYAAAAVQRYADRVRSWQVCAGFNHSDCHGLGEDDRLRLAARVLEAARDADPDASLVLGVPHPWGDYLAAEDHTYSPLVFTDNLVRAGFEFAAVELEVLAGSHPRASLPRDTIGNYRLIELFGLIALPLEVTLGVHGDPAGRKVPDFATLAAVALSLPQVRAVRLDFPDAAGRRDGSLVPAQLLTRLRELRLRYLA